MCENLCIAYQSEYGVPVRIARLAQTFGAGILKGENRVFAQFARSAMTGTDIVLHTKGLSETNCCYTRDMIRGLSYILTRGNAGEAYNVVNESTHCTIADAAHLVAEEVFPEIAKSEKTGSERDSIRVVFDIKDSSSGYAKDVKLRLDGSKLRVLGWNPEVDLKTMYRRLIEDMKHKA